MGNDAVVVVVFSRILTMSITAGIIICMVFGIRFCIRKAPKIFSYLLWSVVLFRLLCPVAAVSRFSALGIWDTSDKSIVSVENGSFASRNILPEDAPSKGEEPLGGDGAGIRRQADLEQITIEFKQADSEKALLWVGGMVWLIGMAAILGYGFFSVIRLKRRLAEAVCVKRNIYCSNAIDTPFAMGIFAPKIYLPDFLGEQEREFIILHEQMHIRRGDPAIKLLAFAALAVHWFNPLVWAAFFAAEKDMEMSCDEMVMKKIKDDIRASYSTSLLRLAVGKRMIGGMPFSFGEGNVKGRILNIMRYKKPAAFVVFMASVLVVGCLVGFGTNPALKKDVPAADTQQKEPALDTESEVSALDDTEGAVFGTEPGAVATENDDATAVSDTKSGQKETGAENLLYAGDFEFFLGNFGADRFWGEKAEGNGEQAIYSTVADITHDGIPDRIDLMINTAEAVPSPAEYMKDLGNAYIKVYEGKKDGGFGKEALYVSGEVADAHVGNGQMGLARKDGQDYLLFSNMYEMQGQAGYCFVAFYLDTVQKTAVCAQEALVRFRTIEEGGIGSVRAESLKNKDVVEFRRSLDAWVEDAELFISCDVGDDAGVCLSKPGDAYRASDYYGRVWERKDE